MIQKLQRQPVGAGEGTAGNVSTQQRHDTANLSVQTVAYPPVTKAPA